MAMLIDFGWKWFFQEFFNTLSQLLTWIRHYKEGSHFELHWRGESPKGMFVFLDRLSEVREPKAKSELISIVA